MAWSTTDFTTRLGKLFGYANDVKTKVEDLYVADITSVFVDFDGTDDRPAVANLAGLGIDETGLPNSIGGPVYVQISQSIQSFIIEYVRRETSVYDGTIDTALREVKKQIDASSDTFMWVGTSSISTSLTTASNQGNGALIARAYRPGSTTVFRQEMFTETINLRCTQGGNVSNFGQGVFELIGLSSLSDTNTEWPGGSGTKISVSATTASVTSTIGTPGVSLLANGDFESWNGNTPLAWDIVTGTAGTQIFQGTTAARGSYSLQFTGNGATLTRIRQQIASASGAPTQVLAETDYALVLYARVGAATTGTVVVALRDAAGTTVGSAITLNLASLTTTYAISSTTFSIAKSALPTTLYLDIYSTTAIANTGILYIDEVVLAPMTQMYAGGPTVLIYPGTKDWAINDTGSITVTSNASVNGAFMKGFQRWLQPEQRGIYLTAVNPSVATIDDALVTV
jgi:hypothetical protein